MFDAGNESRIDHHLCVRSRVNWNPSKYYGFSGFDYDHALANVLAPAS